MDRRSSGDQARSPDAAEPAQWSRPPGAGSLPGDPQMTAPLPLEAGRPGDDEALRRRLDQTWRQEPGLWGWLTSVDHKSIGKRYIVTAMIFFVLGGLEAGAMRAQLARPENTVLGPDAYNQFFTMHGMTMMFLFAVPVVTAVGLYLVPIMIGARNVAFPRLNAYGYWVYLAGGLFLY